MHGLKDLWHRQLRSNLARGCGAINLGCVDDRYGHQEHGTTGNHGKHQDFISKRAACILHHAGNVSNNRHGEKTISDVGTTIGTVIGKGMMYGVMSAKEWGEDVHCFDVGLGWGVDYGGLGLKVGWRAPLIFGLSAGFGYNTEYDEKHVDDKKMPWNVAMQMWMKNFNVALNLAPRYYKKRNRTETWLGVMFNYVKPVYRHIGVTGGIGLSIGLEESENNTPTRFEWNLGLVFRFRKD